MSASIIPSIKLLEDIFKLANKKFYKNELQNVVLTLSKGEKGTLGWFTVGKQWVSADGEKYHEINVCSNYLNRPFESVLSTILHEMVHLYCEQNEIQDTSRGNTYHNKNFKKYGEMFGLMVTCTNKKYGYQDSVLNTDGFIFLESLKKKNFDLHFHTNDIEKPKKKSSTKKYVCPLCDCSVRATKIVNIACLDCEVQMVMQGGEDDE